MEKVEWHGKNKKAIAPIRVSSAGQDGNTSWETQERDCRDYCKRHGLELVDVIPIVETARNSELRVKYGAVLKRAFKENIQHILFHKYDRESRNLTDNETNEILVREGKIVLHYVAEEKVLYKYSPDSDFLMRDYQAVQNKHYSRDLSSKVRRATQTKAEHGWFPGSSPPKGYINVLAKNENGFENRQGTIIVSDRDIVNLRLVQREFEMRAENPTPSLRDMRKRIIAERLIPSEQIKNYHIASLERRLKNIFYDGRFLWQGEEYIGKHERIISSSTFWKVQETFGIRTPCRKNPDALFGQGWIKCGEPSCGCVITFDPKTKKIKSTGEMKTYRYYHCSNGKGAHRSLKVISEDNLMNQFSKVAREITIAENFRDELLKAVNKTFLKMKNAVKNDLERFKAALAQVDQKENRAYDHYDNGTIDKDDYNRQRKRFQDERNTYTTLMEQAQLSINDAGRETVESIIELANNAESLWKHMTTEERRLLLDKVLSNRVLNDVTVEYEIIKPLRVLREMKLDQKWRG